MVNKEVKNFLKETTFVKAKMVGVKTVCLVIIAKKGYYVFPKSTMNVENLQGGYLTKSMIIMKYISSNSVKAIICTLNVVNY